MNECRPVLFRIDCQFQNNNETQLEQLRIECRELCTFSYCTTTPLFGSENKSNYLAEMKTPFLSLCMSLQLVVLSLYSYLLLLLVDPTLT